MNITKNIFKKNNAINKIKDQKIREINLEECNKKCFDCQNVNPQYISLYNGIFICERCVNYIHKRLDSSISLIINNNLQNLYLKELQYLYYGGNKKLLDFINYEYPILKTLSKTKLYLTKAMDYYRKWLKYLIYAGQKPVKPFLEQSIQLIDLNNKNDTEKNINKFKDKIINIDFLNNCYNYENDNSFTKIIPTNNNYNTIYKNNFNDLNYSITLNNKRGRNRLSIHDNKIKIYNSDIEDSFNRDSYYKDINKTNINNNINNSNSKDINTNKLITKRLSLKNHNKNYNNIIYNPNNKSVNNSINITEKTIINNIFNKNKNNITNNNNNNIYMKPKYTLLNTFQKNAISRSKIENENIPNIRNSLYVPFGNNYQTILINNNIYDKLLMYNFDDSSNRINDNTNLNNPPNLITARTITNTKKILNKSSNYENSNIEHTDDTVINNNNDIVFKKKTLKNSFSVKRRRIKEKKDEDNDINEMKDNNNKYININNSMVEKSNFKIISDKSNDNLKDKANNEKMNKTTYNNNNIFINNNRNENKKEIEILSEIKVKRKNKYIIGEKKTSLLHRNNHPDKKLRKEKTFVKEKNIIVLKDNSKNIKDNKIDRLLTLSKLINNKQKKSVPKINLKNINNNNNNNNNINNNNSKYNTFRPYETTREKEKVFDKLKKSILSNNNNNKSKKKQNHNNIEKKVKEIFLMKSSGKKVKMYKTEK